MSGTRVAKLAITIPQESSRLAAEILGWLNVAVQIAASSKT